MKRGLPRSLLTDNGAAMTAGEVDRGAASTRHRGGHDARLQSSSKRQDRVVLGHRRIAPDGDARRRRRAHPEEAQRRHRRLARAGLSPPQAPRTRHDAASTPGRERRRIEALPRLGRAQGGLPHHQEAHAAALGRDRLGRGHPLPGAAAVAPPARDLGPLRALGPRQRRPRRRAKRRAAVHAVPPRQARQRRWRAPSHQPRRQRWRRWRQRGGGRTSAAAQGHARRPGRNGPAAGLAAP